MTLETKLPELRWRFAPSATELLCLIFGALLIYRYAWIMDDAYVYFRYIDNLVVHGQGLVWNPGEYVEGFSSPVWACLLSVFRALHLNYWVIVQGLGMLCFIAFWWIACLVNRALITEIGENRTSFNLPLIYLTFTYAVSCYFTSGLESPLVAVVAVGYAAAVLWPQSLVLQILVGISPLIRQELLIPCCMFMAYAFLFRRYRPYLALASLLIFVGGYELFRIWYYADLFPNTYYLKDITWIDQGLKYIYDSIFPYQTLPYLFALLVAYSALKVKRLQGLLSRERVVMLAMALPTIFYVIKIGGDPRHFRYLAFPYMLIVFATGGLFERSLPKLTKAAEHSISLLCAIFAFAVACNFPRQLLIHPIFKVSLKDVNPQVNLIGDAAAHRMRRNHLTPRSMADAEVLSFWDSRKRYELETEKKRMLKLNPYGEVIFPDGIKRGKAFGEMPVVSDSWCQNGYLHAAIPIIHNMGLTEPFLARTEMKSDRPAHKYGLRPLSLDILNIRTEYGFVAGAFDRAIADKVESADWIVKNIDSIRLIERKVYNSHNFIENLKLALTRVPTILPSNAKSETVEAQD